MNLVLINNVLLPQCPKCKTIEDEPEFKKEAKMNIKDCTQTKDGTPVKIYENLNLGAEKEEE
jgi:phage FluMu protein Com